MRGWFWEGSDGGAFNGPFFGVRLCRVLGREELREKGLWGAWGEPPGDVSNGSGDALRQRRGKGGEVSLKPAKGCGKDYLVESTMFAIRSCQGDGGRVVTVGHSGDGSDNCIELEVNLGEDRFRDNVEDRFVGSCQEHIF